MVAVPHPVLGAEPFAVIDSFANFDAYQVKQHVRETLGKDYALGDAVCLKQLNLAEFPVNGTHKIIKTEVRNAVLKYLGLI